jgi:murein DD-endopeptidase MepM/ murein hydrolase activator NlpD
MPSGAQARRLLGLGLLVPGLLVASPSFAPPEALPSSRPPPAKLAFDQGAAAEVRVPAKARAVGAQIRKRVGTRRAAVAHPCPSKSGRSLASARASTRSGARTLKRLGSGAAGWTSGLRAAPCRGRPAPERPALEPALLADGSLLASVGPARIPTRLYIGLPRLPGEFPAFTWPVFGPIMSTFGQRSLGWHAGVDIKAETGAPIVAAARGVVHASGWEGSYGWVVKIDHDDGFSTIYAHNLQNLVEVGDVVEAGAVIALVGRSGRASGPHLHFEVRRDGMAYNPLFLLRPGEQAQPEPGEMAAVYPAIDSGDEDGGE